MFARYFLAVMAALSLHLDVQADDRSFVNLAGQQRMLSQRIVKSYSQVGLNVYADRSKFQLEEAVRRFEANLVRLSSEAGTPETRAALEALVEAWQPMHRLALSEVNTDSARKLDLQAEAVLQAADRLTLELQDAIGAAQGRWVNMAGRQRMLSQRLVKAYMLRQYGVDSANLRQQLESSGNEFSGALTALRERSENTPELRSAIDALGVQWEWMRISLAGDGAVSYRLILAEGSDSVLDLADQVTTLLDSSGRQ